MTKLATLACVLFACGQGEPKVTSSAPTFTSLQGGFSQAIAPGDRLVTLLAGGAAWWENGQEVHISLPATIQVDGARWAADGTLRVGLGTLDLAARTWREDPLLAAWQRPSLREVAWTPDLAHVVLLLADRTVVVVTAATGKERSRVAVPNADKVVALDDRILVAAQTTLVTDLDGKAIAKLTSAFRVREHRGMFAVVGATGETTLVRPSDGAALVTWDAHAIDAAPLANGLVSIDTSGTVRIGCIEAGAIRVAAELSSSISAGVIRIVGDQIVVAGGGPKPVRTAPFVNPCR